MADHYHDLAHHFRCSSNHAKAIMYLTNTGDAAAATSAFRAAGSNWEDALALVVTHHYDPARHADLLLRLGTIPGREMQSAKRLEEALAIYESLGMPLQAANVHSLLLSIFSMPYSTKMIDLPKSQEHFEKALALLRELPVSEQLGRLYVPWGWVCIWRMQIASAFHAASQAVEIARKLNSPSLRAVSGALMGGCHWAQGHLHESFVWLQGAWEEADRHDFHAGAASATITAVTHFAFLGDYKEALSWSERETSRPRNAESDLNEILHYPQQLYLHSMMGELKQVRRLMDETSNDVVQRNGRAFLTFWSGDFETLEAGFAAYVALVRQRFESVCNQGFFLIPECIRLAGNYGRAEELLREALSDSVPGGYVTMELMGRQCLARVYAETGRPDKARGQLVRCREIIASGEDWRGLSGVVEWSDAALAVAEKRWVDADHQFAGALETMRRYSMRWVEGPVLRDWGRALLAADQHERAKEKFDEAIELYHRIGAGQPWIDAVLADKQGAGL